jgi:hypothetical protein
MKSLKAVQTCEKLEWVICQGNSNPQQKGKCADNSSLLWETIEKKNAHDNSRPLQKEKRRW